MKYLHIAILLIACLLTSCSKQPEPEPEPEPVGPARRTVLVYIVADNNLGSPSYQLDRLDIDEMQEAVNDGALGKDGRLLIYHNRYGVAKGNYPVLCELRQNVKPDTLKRYPDDTTLYSVDPERMTEVVEDMKKYAPADDYGIVLWSHGTGWMDETSGVVMAPPRRTYGNEKHGNGKVYRMSITSLADALDNQGFSFIYFDCCHMMTVETVYQLRHSAKVIVGSPTELPGYGMNYITNIPMFFAEPDADLIGAAQATFEYYDAMTGALRTCAMSVVDTDKLDKLAEVSRTVYSTFTGYKGGVGNLQDYTRPQISCAGTIYDFASIVDDMEGVSDDLRSKWGTALSASIPYAQSTPWIFQGESGGFRMKTYCGLGSYFITSMEEAEKYGYMNLDWWNDVVKYAYTDK